MRSYGTEDRPAEKFVPAIPTVYSVIVFKGQDIKDCQVFDNIPTDVAEPFVDPAIVSVSCVQWRLSSTDAATARATEAMDAQRRIQTEERM